MTQNHQGLTDPDAMNGALAQGNYTFILKCILGESSLSKRLEYLRDPNYKLQPFLSYERAISEFAENLTKEHMVSVVMPLHAIGALKNEMYAKCSNDRSILGPCQEVEQIYRVAIARFARTALGDSALHFSEEEQKQIVLRVHDLITELLEELQRPDCALPSPLWIRHCGLDAFATSFTSPEQGMKPENEWKQICLQTVHDRSCIACPPFFLSASVPFSGDSFKSILGVQK